jgi:gliding motility-associated-like protein
MKKSASVLPMLLILFVCTVCNYGCRKDWYCIKHPSLSVSEANAAGTNSGGGVTVKTAFTPDGDGTNDLFCLTGTGMGQSSITITDNCGKKLFETNDGAHTCWDGIYKGKKIKGICNYSITDGSGNTLCSGKVQVVE